MKLTLYIIVTVIILWSIYGYFGSRVEQVKYSVLKEANGYEIRQYPAHIVAQTTVKGTYSDSMNEGFRIVAGYIFGGNAKKESIAMTAPVMMEGKTSEKIAMTAPVLVSSEGDSRVISFGMPESYTLSTLPTPTDPRVHIVEVQEKQFAVLRFRWYATNTRIESMEKKLLDALSKDGVKVIGSPSYAGYNAPWTPPWMTRNEVMAEVVYKK